MWSVAKLQAIFMAIFGLIVGVIIAIATQFIPNTQEAQQAIIPFQSFGFLAIIIVPIVYAIMGLVTGAIGAWIYNIVAKLVGGIEVEFEQNPKPFKK